MSAPMRQAPSEESHQHHRGHSHVNATSPNHPRRACAWHRHRNDGPPAPTIHAGHSLGHSHVTRAYTDKSTHSPGSQATITAEASGGGTVHFSVSHLGTEVSSGEAPVTDGAATWTYTTPSEDNQGYLMTATGADDTHAETALDVSSSWTRFPRMGYVSHFKPTAPADITTGTSYESYLSLTPSEYMLAQPGLPPSTHCSTTTGSTDTSSPSPPVTSRTSVRCGTGTPTRRRKRSPITSRREERKHGFTRLLDGIRG